MSELHRHTCDLANPSSPQSTVAILRFTEDRADYLVLADVFVVVDLAGSPPQVVTDGRELRVRGECTTALHGLTPGSSAYEQALPPVIAALRARRNHAGGYWIAKEDPEAAGHAVAGSVPLADLSGAAMLSNGASRIVDPYGVADWPTVLRLMRTRGPAEVLRRVRRAETNPGSAGSTPDLHQPDDATAAWCVPGPPG